MPFTMHMRFNDPSGIITNAVQNAQAAPQDVDKMVRSGLAAAARSLRQTMRDRLAENGRHDSRVTRSKSKPGMAPQMVSGLLRQSVTNTTPQRLGFADYRAFIGPGANQNATLIYAKVQEYGMTIYARSARGMFFTYGKERYRGVRRVRVEARPYVRPTMRLGWKQAQRAFENGMTASLAKSAWYAPRTVFAHESGSLSDYGG